MPKQDDTLARIAEITRASSGRSKLTRWLRVRHDEFLALLDEHGANWAALAKAFAEEGMTTAEGKPFTPETVRVTWYRVRKAVEKSRAKRLVAAVPVAVERPSPIPSPKTQPEPARAPSEGLDAKDALAELRRQMAERSGRKG